MRILFWQESFWPNVGGVQTSGANLLRGLRDRGYSLAVVTQAAYQLPAESNYEDIPVYRFPFGNALSSRDLTQIMQLRGRIEQLKRDLVPDLIHLNGFGPSTIYQLTTNQRWKCPLLLTLHSQNYPSGLPQTLLRKTLCAADWITGGSAAILEYGRQVAPEIRDKNSLIYHGMRKPSLKPAPLPVLCPRILCLGNLYQHKGFDLAIAACASLIHRQDLRVTVAGDGPERASLQRQAEESGLNGRIEFVGRVEPEEVSTLINQATIVVMPSRRESFGLVAIEAALMARPVVASRVGGLPEAIAHEETGLLVEPDSSSELADAIADLVKNPDKALRMGTAARSRALRIFGIEQQLDAYDKLYTRLSSERSPNKSINGYTNETRGERGDWPNWKSEALRSP